MSIQKNRILTGALWGGILIVGLSLALAWGMPAEAGPRMSDLASALSRHVIASGGGPAASTTYGLNATLGQPIVGPSAGGNIANGAGYWYGLIASYPVYLPIVIR